MTVKRLTPPLGAYGKYELKSPWQVANNLSYRCVSLRRVEEFVKSNKDLYKTVYEPIGLSEEVCKADIELGVVIVGLLASDGSRIFVPDTYILKYPDQTAVAYNYTVVSVDLGPQPSNIDLTDAMVELRQVASKYTGIDVSLITVKKHYALSTTVMTQEQYIAAADARQHAIENVSTSEEIIADLRQQLNEAQQLIQQLADQNA